jgi:hypothetical protein
MIKNAGNVNILYDKMASEKIAGTRSRNTLNNPETLITIPPHRPQTAQNDHAQQAKGRNTSRFLFTAQNS